MHQVNKVTALVNSVRFLTTSESARTRTAKLSCISIANEEILKQRLYNPFVTLKKLFGILQNERPYLKNYYSEYRRCKCEHFNVTTDKNPNVTTSVTVLSSLIKCKLVHHALAWLSYLTCILQAAWAYLPAQSQNNSMKNQVHSVLSQF